MALSISTIDTTPTFLSSISTSTTREIASARKSKHDEDAQAHQSTNVQPPTQIDRVEISQEARQQARAVQISNANPGTNQETSSPFDTK